MKSAISFNSFDYIKTLEKSGIHKEQANAMASALFVAFEQDRDSQNYSTKQDLKNECAEIRKEIIELKLDFIKTINSTAWKIITALVAFQTLSLGIFGYIQHLIK